MKENVHLRVILIISGCLLVFHFRFVHGISDLSWSFSSLPSSGVPLVICVP